MRAIPPAALEGFTHWKCLTHTRNRVEAITSSQVTALEFGLDPGVATHAVNSSDATPGNIQALMQRVKRYTGNWTLAESEFLSDSWVAGRDPRTAEHRLGSCSRLNVDVRS